MSTVLDLNGGIMQQGHNFGSNDVGTTTVKPKNEDLQPWFGIPDNPVALVGDNSFVTRRQLPYAYRGKNTVLASNIEGLVLNDSEEILSEEYGVPRRVTDSLHFKVSTLIFDEGMLDVEPEEGVARHMRFAQRSAEGTLIRKSKGMHFEHGFLYTPEGRERYYQQQIQLANTIVHDMIYNTLISLRDSRHDSIEMEMRQGLFNYEFRELVKQKNHEFAMFQKYYDAPKKLETKVRTELQLRGASPNVCICSRGLEYFWQGTGDENRLYSKAGPAGPARVAADPNSVTRVGSLKLVFTRLFQAKNAGQYPLDPLIRTRMNGEYFIMSPPPLEVIDEHYKTSNRNIKVIDLQRNNWGTITLKAALDSCPMFGEDKSLTELTDKASFQRSMFRVSDGKGSWKQAVFFGDLPKHIVPDDVFKAMEGQIIKKGIDLKTVSAVEALAAEMAVADLTGRFESVINARAERTVVYEKTKPSSSVMKFTGKRMREEVSPSSNSYRLVTFNASKSGTDVHVAEPVTQSLHDQNRELLQAHPDNLTSLYTSLSEGHDLITNRGAFEARVNASLKSTDPADANNLFAAMDKVLSKELSSKKQIPSVQFLNSYPEKSGLETSASKAPASVPETSSEIMVVNSDFYNENSDILSLVNDRVYSSSKLGDILELHQALSNTSEKSGIDMGKFLDVHKGMKFDALEERFESIIKKDFNSKQGLALACCQLNYAFFEFLLDHDIYFPFSFLIFRPWMVYITSTLIIMQGGEATAVNYYMKPDVMLSDNETIKTHSGHMTVHLSPFVKKPANIKVKDDVAVRRYVSGGTARGYTPDELVELAHQHRWQPGTHPDRPSWFSVMIPMTTNDLHSIIDFRGYFTGQEGDYTKLHFISCALTVDKYLGSHPDNINPMSPATKWDAEDAPYNSVCAQGTQLCYNYSKKDFTAIIVGDDSPLGPNVYAGMRTVMEGLETLFEDQHYHDVSKYKVYEAYQ